jgi:drug/metabolite transporter (DMT)-like permease
MEAKSPTHLGATPYLLLTLPPLFWASNWIIGRALHTEIPPMAMTFFRWLIAIVILAPFAWPHVRRDWPVIRAHWKTMVALGAIGVGTHNGLAYLGLNYTTATNGVILNSFIPVLIIAISWIFLRERLTPIQCGGLLISLTGVLTVVSRGDVDTLLGFRLNVGDLFILLSMLMWAVYTIGLRWRPPGINLLSFLLVIAVVGDLSVVPLVVGEMALGRHVHWSWTVFGALVAVALFSSLLAYIVWNRGVEAVGANVAGLFVHLMPVFGVLLAWLFLGERVAPYHIAGIALILTGIWATSRFGAKHIEADEVAAVGTD